MITKRVGDTLTIEHLPDERGRRIADQESGKAIFVPLSLVRVLSSALPEASADTMSTPCKSLTEYSVQIATSS